MTKKEIQQWLDWAVESGLMEQDEYSYVMARRYRYYMPESCASHTMQIALQEETVKQGWFFTLGNEPQEKYEVGIWDDPEYPYIGIATSSNPSHAFMIAFKQAWEEVNDE